MKWVIQALEKKTFQSAAECFFSLAVNYWARRRQTSRSVLLFPHSRVIHAQSWLISLGKLSWMLMDQALNNSTHSAQFSQAEHDTVFLWMKSKALTSSCGASESSLSERYMTMCGTCAMDICSSTVSSPHSRRTSWLTTGAALALLPAGQTVSRVNLTWGTPRNNLKVKQNYT